MTTLEVKLPDEIVERLHTEAVRRNLPVDSLVKAAIENYLEDDIEYEDEDEAEILKSLREGIEDVAAGRTYPIDELFNKSRKVRFSDAD